MISINKLCRLPAADPGNGPSAMGAVLGVFFTLSAMSVPVAWAAEQAGSMADGDESSLKLPDDLAAKAGNVESEVDGPPPKFEIEERRVGGRLERVTVKRANGLDEVYENKEIDSMFSKEDNELGEVQNVRRWTLGTW